VNNELFELFVPANLFLRINFEKYFIKQRKIRKFLANFCLLKNWFFFFKKIFTEWNETGKLVKKTKEITSLFFFEKFTFSLIFAINESKLNIKYISYIYYS